MRSFLMTAADSLDGVKQILKTILLVISLTMGQTCLCVSKMPIHTSLKL